MARGHRSQIKRARNEQTKLNKKPVAHARYVRVSPIKAKYVLDLIRGKDVKTAMAILLYTPTKSARVIAKVLKSAMANAENNKGMEVEALFVETAIANQGPSMKRIRPRAQGRAFRIEKKTSHMTIELGTK